MTEKRPAEAADDQQEAGEPRKQQKTGDASTPSTQHGSPAAAAAARGADPQPTPAAGGSVPAATAAAAAPPPAAATAPAASSSCLQPLQLRHAVSSDKGTRTTMEDVHICVEPQLDSTEDSDRVWHFALFDGHGGVSCATFASQRLHAAALEAGLLTRKSESAGRTGAGSTAGAPPPAAAAAGAAAAPAGDSFQLDVKAARQAVVKLLSAMARWSHTGCSLGVLLPDSLAPMQGEQEAFTSTDEQLLQQCARSNWTDGATCVAVWLVGSTALVANIGDAKCVLARRAQQDSSQAGGKVSAGQAGALRAVVLTKDHLAMYPEERARIDKAGGHVTGDGRLNGRMQVSRSFGDAQFKGSGCSAVPAVTAFTVGPREAFLLAGCDGFWSVMDAQGAVDLVQAQLSRGKDPKAVTNRLLHEAVTERRCKDNCTVMLVLFQP